MRDIYVPTEYLFGIRLEAVPEAAPCLAGTLYGYNLMKQWATIQKDALYAVLGSRFIMYGEWMYAKHTVWYDNLPHYFMEFDIYDRERGIYLDTPSRQPLAGLPHRSQRPEPQRGRAVFTEAAMRKLEQKYPGIGAFWEKMGRTPQNPSFHGEGDVLTHTRLVVEALTKLESFHRLPKTQQKILFLAAALHDAGKPITTRLEDGEWVSPHHGAAGAQLVRAEQISLFESYGASVRIVYLETDWRTNRERNRNREAAVPEDRLEKMLSILEPPSPWEARNVEWITTG